MKKKARKPVAPDWGDFEIAKGTEQHRYMDEVHGVVGTHWAVQFNHVEMRQAFAAGPDGGVETRATALPSGLGSVSIRISVNEALKLVADLDSGGPFSVAPDRVAQIKAPLSAYGADWSKP